MRIRIVLVLAAALAFGVATTALAVPTFTLAGGTGGNIASTTDANDLIKPLGFPDPLAGQFGAEVSLSGPARLTFTFLGKEAGWTNSFWFGGTKIFDNSQATDCPGGVWTGGACHPAGTLQYTTVASGGLLPFMFKAPGSGSYDGRLVDNTVANPVPFTNAINSHGFLQELPNFFASIDSAGALTLWFDDGGGGSCGGTSCTTDDNHDDMLVKVTAAPVPEPGSMLLLGSGLAALLARSRRRKA